MTHNSFRKIKQGAFNMDTSTQVGDVHFASITNPICINLGALPDNGAPLDLSAGTHLDGGYVIERRLCSMEASSDADLYLCAKNGQKYVAKVYRRKCDRNDLLIHRLNALDSPNVAHIFDSGMILERFYQITAYYRKGSLASQIEHGHLYDAETLKTCIIPTLNKALRMVHNAGMQHRNIKSSNIMIADDDTLVLIDFDMSSVETANNGAGNFKENSPAQYQASEVPMNIYYQALDYYSLGIVLYELFCGHLPPQKEGLVFPCPDDMPTELYILIRSLTLSDWKGIDDKNEGAFNRRWGYNEVCRWLNDVAQPMSELSVEENDQSIRNVVFCGKTYYDMDDLCRDMVSMWEEGKAFVSCGTLKEQLQTNQRNERYKMWITNIDECTATAALTNEAYTKLLYRLSPALSDKVISNTFAPMSLHAFGEALMKSLKNMESILTEDGYLETLRCLLNIRQLSKIAQASAAEGYHKLLLIEELLARTVSKIGDYGRLALCWQAAYILASEKKLQINGVEAFSSAQELKEEIDWLCQVSRVELFELYSKLLQSEKKMHPSLYGWLAAQGWETTDSEWLI